MSLVDKILHFMKVLGHTTEPTQKKSPPMKQAGKKKYTSKGLMLLELKRKWYTTRSTIGKLYIDGKFECYILEDYDRIGRNKHKVYGETAIPGGTYDIRITHSPRFKKKLPLLRDVPGFKGIRIHAGNTAKDTEGCLLPGQTRSKNFVGRSKLAFNALFKKLTAAKQDKQTIKITIN